MNAKKQRDCNDKCTRASECEHVLGAPVVQAKKRGAKCDFSSAPDFSSCSAEEIISATKKIFEQVSRLNTGGPPRKRKLSADISKHSGSQDMPLVSSVDHVTFHTQSGPQLPNFLGRYQQVRHKPIDLNSFKFPA